MSQHDSDQLAQRQPPRAIILILCFALGIPIGCAYQLETGHRDMDRSCRFVEKCTAPIAQACAWTAGAALWLVGETAANSDGLNSDDCEVPKRHDDSSGNDNSNSVPEGKPLR